MFDLESQVSLIQSCQRWVDSKEAEPAADLDAGQCPKSPKVRGLHKHWRDGNEIASAG